MHGQNTLTMPREIRAEEIEQFLATVEGVATVRLRTSPSGEVDQIYVTAGDGAETRAVRRSIGAALMTAYGLPVEPWRIQVTRLRGSRAAELPDWHVVRVEEGITQTQITARIQVACVREGEQRTGTGEARGPVGPAHRLRTLASATLEAVRGLLDPPHRRITLHQVALTTFADRSLALVGITAAAPGRQEIVVGVALQRDELQEAAITATLDAVAKWLLRAASADSGSLEAGDRRARLEAMRHIARSEWSAKPVPDLARVSADQPSRNAGAAEGKPPPPRALPYAETGAEHAVDSTNSDILDDLSEIRPERKGGAVMATHPEAPRVGISPPRPGRQATEDGFYQAHIDARTPLRIRCRDGYEIPRAVLRDIGTYTLLVESGGTTELVYKHAIISVRPIDGASEA